MTRRKGELKIAYKRMVALLCMKPMCFAHPSIRLQVCVVNGEVYAECFNCGRGEPQIRKEQ